MVSIKELFNKLEQKLNKEWSGSYYLYTSVGHIGVKRSGFDDIPQRIGIEVKNSNHPDKQRMEIELLRITNDTDWHVRSDGFFDKGHSDNTREIFLRRDVDIENDDEISEYEFEESVQI